MLEHLKSYFISAFIYMFGWEFIPGSINELFFAIGEKCEIILMAIVFCELN